MIKIQISSALKKSIYKQFKKDSLKVYALLDSLKENPRKGKYLATVGVYTLKELKFGSFRFYFILHGHKLLLFEKGEIEELLIRFLKMSKKHNQQKTVDEIKDVLFHLGT